MQQAEPHGILQKSISSCNVQRDNEVQEEVQRPDVLIMSKIVLRFFPE